jgi:hypothetical protein
MHYDTKVFSKQQGGTMFYCDECGHKYVIQEGEISQHITEDGEIDYDRDEDHVAYGEEEVSRFPTQHKELF